MPLRLPKIAASVKERARIHAWLEAHAKTPLRYLCAPAGSGKTTAAVLYARRNPRRTVFVSAPAGGAEGRLAEAIGDAAGLPASGGGYQALLAHLARIAPVEVIVDDVDGLETGAREMLGRLFLDAGDGVTFVYLARCADAVAVAGARARGLVDVCDGAALAFEAHEIERLGQALGAAAEPADAARLREATHGWAIAVSGACRTAVATDLDLVDALRHWQRVNERALQDLVTDGVAAAGPALATVLADVAADRGLPDGEQLARLGRSGIFVTEWHGRLALNPLLRRGAGSPALALDAPVSPAVIEMFGRFEMSIGGTPVTWVRRRDRQIVAYLATRPFGRATRAEIIAAFWPHADRQLAGQSLRTACSTIRRALGACVGRTNVERYLHGDGVLELRADNVIVSTREFTLEIERGAAADACGNHAAAFAHYRAAELLYRAPFLSGEAPAPWMLAQQQHFAALYREAAARLDVLSDGRWMCAPGRPAPVLAAPVPVSA